MVNWNAVIDEVSANLVRWDDLSPRMQTMLLEFYRYRQAGKTMGWGAGIPTYRALERRGLVADESWEVPAYRGHIHVFNLMLTAEGVELVEKYLAERNLAEKYLDDTNLLPDVTRQHGKAQPTKKQQAALDKLDQWNKKVGG